MQTLERLEAGDLAAVMVAYRDVLELHRERINRLNVYPVPDGDTGTNMALTLRSVVAGLPDDPGADLASVAAAISRGSLMGARGNSGVILSQILRGLAEGVAARDRVDAEAIVDGLRLASDGAWKAVQRPVEGTILSVVRAAAEGAGAARAGAGIVDVLRSARAAAAEALERTPEQLAVLRDAGVVDSGGSGLLLLLDAFLNVTAGDPLPDPGPTPAPAASAAPAVVHDGPGGSCRYEVMYLLEADDGAIGAFRSVWAGIGDSIVVVGGDGIYNCHIHTDEIGAAIEAALDAGRPRDIRVTDLQEEVEEERWVREAGSPPPEDEAQVTCAVVAVSTGEGIARIFHSLGVHRVVAGGQSMNPSTADLLDAIDASPAGEVVVLPNNGNVVAVAEAAASASAKAVRVVVTRNVPEGFAALLDYDPEADVAANAASMAAASGRVVAGEVTRAVRASTCPAGPIAEGDHLGIGRDGILVVAPTLAAAATGLLGRLIDRGHHEMVTIIAGEGSTAADTRRITAWIEEHHAGVAAEVHQGGQPLYPYLFGVE